MTADQLSKVTIDECVARMKRVLDKTLARNNGTEEIVWLGLVVRSQTIGDKSGDLVQSMSSLSWTPEKGLIPRIEVK